MRGKEGPAEAGSAPQNPEPNHPVVTQASDTPGRARSIFLLVTALYWASLYLYVPILAPYAEFQGGSFAIVGLVVSAYGLAQLLLRIPVGIASDRIGRRRPFLAVGFLASALASLGFILAPDPWSMVGARFVSGIAACSWVAFTVLFASYFPSSQTTRAMGFITFSNGLSVMAATYIGGYLADLYGWLAPFWASVGVGAIGLVSVALVYEVPRSRPAAQPSLQRLRSVIQYPELVFAALVAALGQYTTFATTFGFVPNYAVSVGATKTELGLIIMLGTLAGSLATLVGGTHISPRLGPRATVFVGHVILGISTAIIPLIHSVAPLYATQILGGFGKGIANPVLLSLAISRLPAAEKATAMGFFQAVYAIGMFSGPAVSGLVGGHLGYTSIFLSTGAVAGLTALVALRLPRKQ